MGSQLEAELITSSDITGRKPSVDRLTITSKGFQFLLEDRQTQLWQIVMFYLTLKEVCEGSTGIADDRPNRERSAEVLSIFFSLGCMQLGQVRLSYNACEETDGSVGLLRIRLVPQYCIHLDRSRSIRIDIPTSHA